MRRIKWGFLLLVAGAWIVLSCKTNDDEKVAVAQVDRDFAATAAEINLMGVRTAELVETRANSSQVKQYGISVTDYYRIATQDLLALSRQKNISLPTALGVPNQQEFNRLAGFSGAKFDSAYIDWSVRANEQAIAALRQHSTATSDTDFKNWVDARITTLEQNQQKAIAIQKALTNATGG
jgi:putative membrane protein